MTHHHIDIPRFPGIRVADHRDTSVGHTEKKLAEGKVVGLPVMRESPDFRPGSVNLMALLLWSGGSAAFSTQATARVTPAGTLSTEVGQQGDRNLRYVIDGGEVVFNHALDIRQGRSPPRLPGAATYP